MWWVSWALAQPIEVQHPTASPDDARFDPIYFGQVEEEFTSTVGIGAAGFTFCSANLITPRILLTAAHCSADFPIELVVAFGEAYFGTESAGAPSVGFADSRIHPKYQELSGAFLGEYDLAMLVLAEDAPVAPVWIRDEPLSKPDFVGTEVVSVGYGLDEDGGSGVRKSATLVVSDLDPMFVLSNSRDNEGGANICSGDSGGPQFSRRADGSWEQVAVHSWGDVDCLFQSGSTRVDADLEWILALVEEVHGTRDRCAFNGHYGDGVCDEFCAEQDPDCLTTLADWLANSSGEYVAEGGCQTTTATTLGPWALLALLGLRRRGRRAGGHPVAATVG